MNVRTLAVLVSAAAVIPAFAQTQNTGSPAEAEARAKSIPYITWEDPQWWEDMRTTPHPVVSIGSTDLTLQGPLVDTFRPARMPEKGLLGKISRIPIVNLLVPQPIAVPPRGSGPAYLAWGETDMPWSELADHKIPGPQSVLLSLSK